MKPKLCLVGRPAPPVDLERLAIMRPPELQQLHRRVFGTAVASGNSEQARRRIAWQIQTEREGGLPESARQHALAIAREVGSRLRSRLGTKRRGTMANSSISEIVSEHDPRLPMPGSVLVKEYRGRTIEVYILDSGFEYDARRFTSLSALAKEITGTKWNGLVFFGLGKAKARGR